MVRVVRMALFHGREKRGLLLLSIGARGGRQRYTSSARRGATSRVTSPSDAAPGQVLALPTAGRIAARQSRRAASCVARCRIQERLLYKGWFVRQPPWIAAAEPKVVVGCRCQAEALVAHRARRPSRCRCLAWKGGAAPAWWAPGLYGRRSPPRAGECSCDSPLCGVVCRRRALRDAMQVSGPRGMSISSRPSVLSRRDV
jgi:hypothetical protein